MERCVATTVAGEPCRSMVKLAPEPDGSGVYCLMHSHSRRQEAQAARKKGGTKARPKSWESRTVTDDELPPMPRTQEECEEVFRWVLAAELTGRIDTHTAREAANVLAKLSHTIGSRLGLTKRARDLQARLKAAEEENRKLRGDGGTLH